MYSTDNPFNPAVSSAEVVKALPYWDVIATPRRASIPKLKEYCRGNVLYLPFGYDPDLHYPEQAATQKEKERLTSDVVFIGGCDPDRVPYLDSLARAEDIKVHLYGGYYRFTPALRRCKKGYAYGRTYRLVLGATSVAVCLVRRANGDGHVMRTFETPACGAFQLAERTEEHEEIFVENREAVFFDDPQELLDKARFYAVNASARRKIAECGYRRVTGTPNTYSDRVNYLLKHLDS
jgi:spore maturation protein CgeB